MKTLKKMRECFRPSHTGPGSHNITHKATKFPGSIVLCWLFPGLLHMNKYVCLFFLTDMHIYCGTHYIHYRAQNTPHVHVTFHNQNHYISWKPVREEYFPLLNTVKSTFAQPASKPNMEADEVADFVKATSFSWQLFISGDDHPSAQFQHDAGWVRIHGRCVRVGHAGTSLQSLDRLRRQRQQVRRWGLGWQRLPGQWPRAVTWTDGTSARRRTLLLSSLRCKVA